MSLHRDFLAEPKARQWSGPLPRLFHTLREEAEARPGVRVWRVLPRGAFVALKARQDGCLELRIARRDRPTSPARFEAECDVFRLEFGVEGWTSVAEPESAGICRAFLGPACAEASRGCPDCGGAIEPGVVGTADRCLECATKRRQGLVPCARCGEEWVKPDPAFAITTCTGCAFEAGREHAAEVRARTHR